MITVYTDGSAVAKSNSPYYRLGGMAAVFVEDGRVIQIIHKGYRNTKTGRMELRAALIALQSISKDHPVIIYCDSQYVVKTFSEHWIEGWERNGWPCKNVDLMKELLKEYRRFRPGMVKFRHVKGHNGNQYNELADQYASYKNFKEFEQDLPNGADGEIIREEIDLNLGKCWYYHENSDCFWVDNTGKDWGDEWKFVHNIGAVIDGTVEELNRLLVEQNHSLANHPNLKDMVSLSDG